MDNRKRYTVSVGGTEYALQTMPADKANDVLFVVGGAVGAPLEALLRAAGPQFGLAEMFKDENSLAIGAQVISLLVRNLGSSGMLGIRDSLFEGAAIDNKKIDDIDAHFAGRIAEMYQLMWEAIKENYGDFFGILRSLFGQLNAGTADPQG